LERSNPALRIGLLTDAMPGRSLEDVVRRAQQTGLIQDLEIGTGEYSPSPQGLLAQPGGSKWWRQSLDNRWPHPPNEVPRNFVTVGRAHDQEWWRTFIGLLRDVDFQRTISIEYENPFISVEESVLESARLLSTLAGL